MEAKLTPVSAATFCAAYDGLLSNLEVEPCDSLLIEGMPSTMTEPGVKGRFVFATDVYATVCAIVRASARLPSDEARLLKVLLGAVLITNSNVTINGKGRRYLRGWETRGRSAADLIASLDDAVDMAAGDRGRNCDLPSPGGVAPRVHRGACRLPLARPR